MSISVQSLLTQAHSLANTTSENIADAIALIELNEVLENYLDGIGGFVRTDTVTLVDGTAEYDAPANLETIMEVWFTTAAEPTVRHYLTPFVHDRAGDVLNGSETGDIPRIFTTVLKDSSESGRFIVSPIPTATAATGTLNRKFRSRAADFSSTTDTFNLPKIVRESIKYALAARFCEIDGQFQAANYFIKKSDMAMTRDSENFVELDGDHNFMPGALNEPGRGYNGLLMFEV